MADDDRRRAQAVSFGAAAAAYERGRPPYPPQAVDWLLPAGASRVLDLGAGTGKLTRQLHSRGLDVIAVEPLPGMREQLARAVPGVSVRAGTGEDIPLEDASVDAVLVAQAWHWMDTARASAEAARVLRPGGRLGLVWNLRDERADWVAALSRLLRDPGEREDGESRGRVGPPFGPVERFTVDWTHRLSADELVDMVASRSYVITMPEAQRAAVLADVRALVAEHPDLAGADVITLPYVTHCFRGQHP
ncbi:MAG TPA: methyltransferase domain-containing protein [Streptosporangiaceae bacterium]|jgi:SAM-dependent methyltransferase|nr:methyltransferase domain-containing protein [Streptosporangiaceae bacterium]